MTHRADQIVDAIVDAIATWSPSTVKVYAHRRLSLSDDQDELPAISVDFGEDTPVGEEGSYLTDGTIQSLLTVNVTALATAVDEASLRRELLRLRAHVHVAINKVRGLGLPFVIDTHYGGANPPEVDVSGDAPIGELTTPWGVRYEMTLNTPE